MYLPKQFEETRIEVLHSLVREPFGTLVVMTSEGLSVDHIPFLIDQTPGPLVDGLLRENEASADALAALIRNSGHGAKHT